MRHPTPSDPQPAAVSDPPSVPSPAASRGGSARALRRRIVEVATKLFASRGFTATTMREVAQAAGCTKPALYYYFDSKAALFLAIIREQTDRIHVLLDVHLTTDQPLRKKLQHAMAAYFQHVREEPHALAVLARAELHTEHGQPSFDFRSLREMYKDMLRRVLRGGVTRGELRHDLDMDDVLAVFIGVVDYRCTLWLTNGEPIPLDYPERVVSLLFEGLTP